MQEVAATAGVRCCTWIATTRRKSYRGGRRWWRKTQEKTIDIASVSPADDDPEKRIERYINEVVICGTPEKVADDLEQYRESMKLNYLLCTPLSHSSFMLFTEKVLPKFL